MVGTKIDRLREQEKKIKKENQILFFKRLNLFNKKKREEYYFNQNNEKQKIHSHLIQGYDHKTIELGGLRT